MDDVSIHGEADAWKVLGSDIVTIHSNAPQNNVPRSHDLGAYCVQDDFHCSIILLRNEHTLVHGTKRCESDFEPIEPCIQQGNVCLYGTDYTAAKKEAHWAFHGKSKARRLQREDVSSTWATNFTNT
ncbi:hypothetical protein RvY_17137 [Ramazzottius varieornatus]|uniref:Uncharacterized protein n=1 Tax=Ramazzottius varieornatus TaxID=947166 RepID=A0A1D1W894_RAMVA|nr:hypothetical protein RvY_17137 [Ramazzottius varieornatus]